MRLSISTRRRARASHPCRPLLGPLAKHPRARSAASDKGCEYAGVGPVEARRWRMATTTPPALLGLRISGRRLGSLSLSRAVHPNLGGTSGPTDTPTSTLTRGSKGPCRGAPSRQGLGLVSPPAGGEGGQEIRWPAASTRRAGLGVRPPPPVVTPWSRDARGRRLLVRQGTSGAPTPTAARARRRERRPDSSLRCPHGGALSNDAARQGAACGGLLG